MDSAIFCIVNEASPSGYSLLYSSGYSLIFPHPSLVHICRAAAASKQDRIRTTVRLSNALSVMHLHVSERHERLMMYRQDIQQLDSN